MFAVLGHAKLGRCYETSISPHTLPGKSFCLRILDQRGSHFHFVFDEKKFTSQQIRLMVINSGCQIIRVNQLVIHMSCFCT